MKPEIEFVRMSPFDIAAYDTERNMIVVDEAFRDSPALEHIVAHEMRHAHSGSRLDLLIEISDRTTKTRDTRREMTRRKPLSLLAFLFPLIIYSTGGQRFVGLDPSRLVFCCVSVAAFVAAFFLYPFLAF